MHIERASTSSISEGMFANLRALCDLAYGSQVFETFGGGEHVLGFERGQLVCHAMWITRWLQPDGCAPLKTAYVELVATHPQYRRRGYATAIMKQVAVGIANEELGALAPATLGLYERLGWRLWRGPMCVRTDLGDRPTPDERVMVLLLPRSPALDFNSAISIEWRPGEIW